MRWDNLKATGRPGTGDAGPVRALPLALPGAVVRTFDTPEFRGVTFYEVQAKSLVNRVPGTSRVPFEWTINPYRGCSHACVYCLAGDTAILMADGTTRPLADLRVGDEIIGTVRDGRLRRYVTTTVLAHWSTVKPAHRVTLQDGTTLVASGDHRFLSDRGWKHVTGARHGRARRPHLTTANRLAGFGALPERPEQTPAYRRGYLCGFVHGDGHVGPVAPAALQRARAYATACGGLHAMAADDREYAGASVRDASAVLDWPAVPTRAWRQGFVAGLFDAGGQLAAGQRGQEGGLPSFDVVDKVVVDWLVECLSVLGFAAVTEGALTRVLGGVRERLRFGLMFAPATPTGTVTGELVRGDEGLRVTAIEPLGVDVPMFDITTGTGDFIAGGVVSHNCFARNTHTYLDLDAGHDFDSQIVVKVNAGEVLRRELSARSWPGRHLAMGTNVDCYQRAEGRYRLMPDILAALRDHANPFSILTKGTLIARDLQLLSQAAAVTSVSVSMSIGFVDEPLWRSVEPGTPSPRRRLDVVRRFADAGFAVGVLMAPILPGLTDTPESIDATVAALAAAGAASVVPLALHLRPGAREWYQAWLTREHPHLAPRYRQLYGDGAYAGQAYQREVAARVRLACRRHGLPTGDTSTTRQPSAGPPSPEPMMLPFAPASSVAGPTPTPAGTAPTPARAGTAPTPARAAVALAPAPTTAAATDPAAPHATKTAGAGSAADTTAQSTTPATEQATAPRTVGTAGAGSATGATAQTTAPAPATEPAPPRTAKTAGTEPTAGAAAQSTAPAPATEPTAPHTAKTGAGSAAGATAQTTTPPPATEPTAPHTAKTAGTRSATDATAQATTPAIAAPTAPTSATAPTSETEPARGTELTPAVAPGPATTGSPGRAGVGRARWVSGRPVEIAEQLSLL